MKRETKILLAILILALILRIIFVYSTPVLWWDETVYANLGYDLSIGKDYSFAGDWSDFVPGGMWPKAGFRAPLLPYLLSIIYFFNLNSLILLITPILGMLSVLLVYFFAKTLFDERVGLYSAFFLALIPIHVYFSGRLLADVLFTLLVLLTLFSFWRGYELGYKKCKIMFGFFFALALLAKYTALWLIPVFFIYLLIRDKSLRFIKDKYLGYSIIIFFIVLLPLFIYSYNTYGHMFGSFIHGFKASSYWGGVQNWNFYLTEVWSNYSVIFILFVFSLIYLIFSGKYKNKEVYLLVLFILIFVASASYMPHKEHRYILCVVPAVCILAGLFASRINPNKIVILAITALLLITLFSIFYLEFRDSRNSTNSCFLQAMNLLKNSSAEKIISDSSSIVYYYTKKSTSYYPNPWNSQSRDSNSLLLFSDFDMSLSNENNRLIKTDLDSNFKQVFECDNRTFVYQKLK